MLRKPHRRPLFGRGGRRGCSWRAQSRRFLQQLEQLALDRRVALRKQGGEHRGRRIDPALSRVAQARGREPGDLFQVALLELHASGTRLVEAELARLALHGLALVHRVAFQQTAGDGELLRRHFLAAQAVGLGQCLAHRLAGVRGLQGQSHDGETGIDGRVATRLDLGAEKPIALHRLVQARGLPVAEHDRQRVQRSHVLVHQRRRRPGDGKVSFLERLPPQPRQRQFPVRLRRTRRRGLERPRRPGEELLRQLHRLRFPDVADDDHHGILGRVPAPVEPEDPLAPEAAHALFRPDHGLAVGMAGKGGSEQLARELSRRRVHAALDLLAHDLDLALQLARIEGGAGHRVRQDVHALGEELRRQDDVVDGLVEARPRVDLAAARLDRPGDLPGSAAGGTLEQHVLVQMRQARLVGAFVGASHAHPHLDGDHRRRVVFLDQQRQPVGQQMSHGTEGSSAAAAAP